MPAYNFQQRFANDVRIGVKQQTVRRKRKRSTKPGDKLMLYTGQRTKSCCLLRNAVCKSVPPVDLYHNRVVLDGCDLGLREREEFAQADGFVSYDEMAFWFDKRYGLPLVDEMEVIMWD